MTEEESFLKELREAFLQEALDLLGRVEELSLRLEKDPENTEVFEELTRLAHNLKGSGKAVGFEEISTLAHGVEDYILALKKHTIPNSPDHLDFLFECLDFLKREIETLASNPEAVFHAEGILHELKRRIEKSEVADIKGQKAEPLLGEKSSLKEVMPRLDQASFRIPKVKLDFLLEAFGEQVILQSVLDRCKDDLDAHRDLLLKTISQMNKLTLELQNHALSLTMVTMKATFTKLERAARDAAHLCGKEIEFSCSGEATEIDKTMIDALSDPLTHMVRNSVDHGLEEPQQRALLGKAKRGKVGVVARRVGGQFWLEVRDDGRGLDPDLLKKKAVEKNILTTAQAALLSNDQAYRLIFSNGFSTKENVSEISGRGVGMNVVEEVVHRLKGHIDLESVPGHGMTIRIKLPLTLAIFNGAVIRVGDSRFVVPSSDIDEISRVRSTAGSHWVKTGERQSSLRIRDELFDVIDLRLCLGREPLPQMADRRDIPILLTRRPKNRAYLIDEILGVQKIVQKPLSDEVKARRGYVAGTLLGDGTPGIVLNLEEFADFYSGAQGFLRAA